VGLVSIIRERERRLLFLGKPSEDGLQSLVSTGPKRVHLLETCVRPDPSADARGGICTHVSRLFAGWTPRVHTAGTWQHVFTTPGTYRYFCELHPYMKATTSSFRLHRQSMELTIKRSDFLKHVAWTGPASRAP
jgi:hypothetical protein